MTVITTVIAAKRTHQRNPVARLRERPSAGEPGQSRRKTYSRARIKRSKLED